MALSQIEAHSITGVYTWGRGWFGQLGSGCFDNSYTPKKIEFPGTKELSFVMATCGDSHTLLLDGNGNIWMSGLLSSIGVELVEADRRNTFAILSTVTKNVPEERFIYIATGQNHNLALSSSSKVYAFGHNDYCKCGAPLDMQQTFFEQVNTNEVPMTLVACGRNHSVACDSRGFPYTWGNLTLGRLGIDDRYFDPQEKCSLSIDRPKEVYVLKTLFLGTSSPQL